MFLQPGHNGTRFLVPQLQHASFRRLTYGLSFPQLLGNLSKSRHYSLEVSYHKIHKRTCTCHILTLKFENVIVQIRKTILFSELVWLLVVA